MKKTNKQLIFERMGLNYNPTNEVSAPSGDLPNDIQNLLDRKYGYFPIFTQEGAQFIPIEGNEEQFRQFIDTLEIAWNDISLPFGESKEHKRKGNIRGMWGVDGDGSADGGFGDGGGGGE